MKEVLLVKPRGFCAGVVRAIDIVELALKKYGPPVFMNHSVVHNEAVVADLAGKGAVLVEDLADVPEGAVVVFSAHGSPPDSFLQAEARKLVVIDATCPLVARVHHEVVKYAREGRIPIVVGHKDHVEVRGTVGQAREAFVVDPGEPLPKYPDFPTDNPNKPLLVVTQTTLSQDDAAEVLGQLTATYGDVVVRNDICYATTNRQEAVKYLAGEVDVILVVGSHQSSNSRRLREVAQKLGVAGVLVAAAENVPWFWVQPADRVGVTSGASTPEHLVEEVVATLEARGFTRREVEVVEEAISFKLPGEFTL